MTMTPERGGIPSGAIQKFLAQMEADGLSPHAVLIARGNDILFEKYYAPFHADYLHREYSDTKSFVAIAVGFAAQDGLLELDDPIGKYFPKECENIPDPRMGQQTIRQMLMMSTPKKECYWFLERSPDRVADYFSKSSVAAPFGSAFQYDSQGSFVMCAMIERLTGKTMVEYLREKLLDKLGCGEMRILQAPGGHSWGDSALLARPRDVMKVVRFLMDGGKIGEEQVLDAQFVKEATSKLIDTKDRLPFSSFGYGYQIWRTYENSFFFNGMGCQFAVASPDKDLIFIINSDNQGIDGAGEAVVGSFFKIVYPEVGDPLPDDPAAQAALQKYADSLVLACEKGEKHAAIEEAIDGKTYVLDDNEMGIKWVRISFAKDAGVLEYENAQGEKSLPFGLCRNAFGVFPEEGYSRDVGSQFARGNYYKMAASAAWKKDNELLINVQVIDEYFGRLWMTFTFEGESVHVHMFKNAEDFFTTYMGDADGRC